MRTVELSDEIYARAERAAAARGVPLDQLLAQVIDQGLPEEKSTGSRVRFPIFEFKGSGALRITKEMIDRAELEDDQERSGMGD